METLSVTIINWGKHQRQDVKKPSWFALSNNLLDNPDLADFGPLEFHVMVYLFCQASQRNSGTINLVFAHASRYGISKDTMEGVLEKLEQRQMVTIDGKNPYARVQNLPSTDRQTDKTDKTDRQTHTSAGAESESVSFNSSDLQKVWNENCGTLPKSEQLSEKRRKAALSRIKSQPNPTYWIDVVKQIAQSDWCNNRAPNSKGWVATFDFLLRPDTHISVLEGKYDNRQNKQQSSPTQFGPRPVNYGAEYKHLQEKEAQDKKREEEEAAKLTPEQREENRRLVQEGLRKLGSKKMPKLGEGA